MFRRKERFGRLRLRPYLLTSLTLVILPLRTSADEKADRLLKDAEKTISSVQSLNVEITGSLRDQRPDRTPLTLFTGTIRLKRPNLARIEFQQVTQKADGTVTGKRSGLIAADGTSVWVYDPQKNEYRKQQVSPTGDNIPVSGTLIDAPAYMFFHSLLIHTDSPPIDRGNEKWQGKTYRVIEFQEAAANPAETPQIRQRLYFGPDNRIHHFVNEQLQGKYVAEWTLTYRPTDSAPNAATFAYAPPTGAKEYKEPPPRMLATGTDAPDLKVEDRDGKPIKLSDMRGKVLVLDFWTIGCGHCLESHVHLNTVARKFGDDVVVLALNVEDTREQLAAWLSKHPEYDALQFALAPTASDRERAMISYQVPGFPMVYVIGKEGKIVKGLLGYDGPTPDLENAIKAAGGIPK